MANGNEKDLFHGTGNDTVALPKHVASGKSVSANPYINRKDGAPKHSNKQKVLKGWSK